MPRIIDPREAVDMTADTAGRRVNICQVSSLGEEQVITVLVSDIEPFIDGLRTVAETALKPSEKADQDA